MPSGLPNASDLFFWKLPLEMVPAKYFLLAWAVLQNMFSPCKSLRFQFVKAGDKTEIQFVLTEKPDDEGLSFNWYKTRADEKTPLFVESCRDDNPEGKFVCNRSGKKLVLEISNTQREDSGRYLCGSRDEDIHVVSALVVGDSYTPSTQVMLLHPAAQDPPSQNMWSNHLACVVHGVSNLVEVSWEVSEGLQQKGQAFLVNNDSGSLTFVSLLPIPKGVQSRGGNMTCEVRFNSSGTSVKKSTMFTVPSSEDHGSKCPLYAVSLAGLGGLALLLLLLGILWHRFSPSKPRFSSKISEAPGSDGPEDEDGLYYSDLNFPRKTQAREKSK